MPARPLPAPIALTRGSRSHAGTVAHAVVARLAGDARSLPTHALTEQAIAAVGSLCRDRDGNRRRAVWSEAASTALAYLRTMPPPPPWTLAGTEVPLGEGRADVVREHPALGVLADELKSGKAAGPGWAKTAGEQARRDARALAEQHGDRALGVRLFVAGSPAESLLVTTDGAAVPLLGSRFCPRQLDLGGGR